MTQRTWIMLLVMGALGLAAFYLSQMTGESFRAKVPLDTLYGFTTGVGLLVALGLAWERHFRRNGHHHRLAWAISAGDLRGVREVLRDPIDVNSDVTGWTPLARTAYTGNIEAARLLLEVGADPNAANYQCRYPLIIAAEHGRVEMVRFLLEAGADPSKQSKPYTEEELRVREGDPSAYPDLRGFTALAAACIYNRTEVVELLLEAKVPLETEADRGMTPLILCILYDRAELAMKLLTAGADPDHADHSGFSPLRHAACRNQPGVVRALLEHGADVNARDPYQQTPLMAAKAYGLPQIVDVLMEHGADPTLRCASGHTAEDHGRIGVEG